MTGRTIRQISSQLLRVLRVLGENTTSDDMRYAVLLIERLVPHMRSGEQDVQEVIMDCFDVLMQVEKTVMRESQAEHNTGTRYTCYVFKFSMHTKFFIYSYRPAIHFIGNSNFDLSLDFGIQARRFLTSCIVLIFLAL